MLTQELTPVSVLRLFETSKDERGEFVTQIIERLDNGEVDPLEVHLQTKCVEDLVKQITSNEGYKKHVLTAAEKYGKSFQHHNAKFEIKEVGVKYDFAVCNDPEITALHQQMEQLKEQIKQRETFLKTVPQKGLELVTTDGECVTVFPPTKLSTTSVAVTLK